MRVPKVMSERVPCIYIHDLGALERSRSGLARGRCAPCFYARFWEVSELVFGDLVCCNPWGSVGGSWGALWGRLGGLGKTKSIFNIC